MPFRGKQLSLEDYTQACVLDEQGPGLSVRQLKSFYEWSKTSRKNRLLFSAAINVGDSLLVV